MKTKRIVAGILAVMLLAAVGCSSKDEASGSPDEAATLSAEAVADAMKEVFTTQGELLLVESSVIDNYYAVTDEVITDYKVYISPSYIAEEIAVLSYAEGKSAEAKKIVEQRLADLKESFDGYRPEELATLESNAVILEGGNKICLLTGEGDGVGAAKKVFEDKTK